MALDPSIAAGVQEELGDWDCGSNGDNLVSGQGMVQGYAVLNLRVTVDDKKGTRFPKFALLCL